MILRGRRGATIAALVSCFSTQAAPSSVVPYPENFRNWVHVKSALVGPQSAFFESSGGIHHIYANEKAMVGYRTNSFPDGSVIVFDLLEVIENAGNTAEGSRLRIDVMAKDSQRFAAAGAWGFERFLKDSHTKRATNAEVTAHCLACHTKRKDHDFVFSEFRK